MANEDAAQLVVDLESCEDESVLELEKQKAEFEVELETTERICTASKLYDKRECSIQLAYEQDRADLFRTELEHHLKPSPLKDPKLAFVLGFATASVAAITMVVVIGAN